MHLMITMFPHRFVNYTVRRATESLDSTNLCTSISQVLLQKLPVGSQEPDACCWVFTRELNGSSAAGSEDNVQLGKLPPGEDNVQLGLPESGLGFPRGGL